MLITLLLGEITWQKCTSIIFKNVISKNSRSAKIIDFATRTTRSSMASDKSILFEPQTDLAVANAICYEIIHNGWVNKSFVEKTL